MAFSRSFGSKTLFIFHLLLSTNLFLFYLLCLSLTNPPPTPHNPFSLSLSHSLTLLWNHLQTLLQYQITHKLNDCTFVVLLIELEIKFKCKFSAMFLFRLFVCFFFLNIKKWNRLKLAHLNSSTYSIWYHGIFGGKCACLEVKQQNGNVAKIDRDLRCVGHS